MEEERDKSDLDLQLKRLSLIDFSSENDALVLNSYSPLSSTSAGLDLRQLQHTENEKQSEVLKSFGGLLSNGKEAGLTPGSDQDDQFPYLKESLEPDSSSRKAKCNLRKSLAWDSAFFTNAGVLDAEELSCIIKGAEKSEKKILPGIEEDFRRSTDSISTLESDNLVMENLEAELFGDIRASIQKSINVFTATSETCNSTFGESQAISSKKKMNTSQNQKHQPALKKPIGISKSQTKQILKTQGTAKVVNQDADRSQVEQSVVRPGNSNPTLLRPPRSISNSKPTPTLTAKRASFVASDTNKMGHDKMTTGTVAGKVPQASKARLVSGARRVLPKSTSSSKASSLDSSNSTKSVTSSLTDSSGSISTEKVSKSHLAHIQRKVGVRTANPPSAGSTLKTPSKTAARNKTTSGKSSVSAYLMSSKISSSISPASSISEWSSASSSSSSTFNFRSKSRTSFETSSCRVSENDLITADWNERYNSQMLDKDENEGITVPSGSTRKSSTETGTHSHLDSARPSGLRLPSPKIGFFDGVKSVRTPNGSMQSHANLAMVPKAGAALPSPSRSSTTKPKIGKLSQTRAVSSLSKKNPQELTSIMSSEKSRTPENVYRGTSDLEVRPISSLEVKYEMDRESCLKAGEVGGEVPDQANNVESAGIGVVMNGSDISFVMKSERRSPDMDGAVSCKDNKVVAIGGEANSEKREILKPLEKVDKDGQENISSLLPSLLRVNEKENAVFREHVDEVSRILGH